MIPGPSPDSGLPLHVPLYQAEWLFGSDPFVLPRIPEQKRNSTTTSFALIKVKKSM